MVLPIALGILSVLSISAVVVLDSSGTNARSASRSLKGNNALALAEAGINNAVGVVMKPGVNLLDKYLFCPDSTTAPTLPCWTTSSYEGGTVQWTGELTHTSGSAYWTLRGTSTVRNPTGGTRPIQRALTARVPVYPAPSQPLNSPSWNYIYSRATGTGVAFSGCDLTLQNSVVVSSPLYLNGNLCITGSAWIASGGLFVRGSLTLDNGNHVGTAAAPVNDAHIAKGCQYKAQTPRNPCVNGAPEAGDNVFATTLDTNAGTVEPPNVLWNDWYLNANPGPYFPCLAPTGSEAPNPTWKFDPTVAAGSASDATKLTYKNNNAGLVNLTPTSSYSCKTFAGEISWNATTAVLTIRGTMFIDGSVVIENKTSSYVGQGVIYMSGTLKIAKTLCGKLDPNDSTTCTTTGWDPNVNLLTFVANGNGSTGSPDSQVPEGDGVQISGARVQGAIYATNIIDIGSGAGVDGPLDGSTVLLGQSSSTNFPPFTIVPSGMPGNETIYAVAGAPELFSG